MQHNFILDLSTAESEPLPQIGRQERVVLDDQRSRQLPPVYVPVREPVLEREAERPV